MYQEPARYVVPLQRCSVTQCRLDYGFVLIINGEDDDAFELRIEQPFVLALAVAGLEVRLDPQGDPTALAPALSLLHADLVDATAFEDGRLVVRFAGGNELRVSSSGDYQAWTFAGPYGLRVVSIPGGELRIWQPDGAARAQPA
ncbi:MAG TPA: DUF6188 family protein [Solirubrobacteraceae bacterium]|jgi:hypothetical protein|nr:DUF6188 family protein [Solirubrobacteraceae bacterium]